MSGCLCVNIEKLEKVCIDLEDIDIEIQQKNKQISDLEEKAKHLKKEDDLQRMIAEVRGEAPPTGRGLEELEQAKAELTDLESKQENLRKKALKGMAELDLLIASPDIETEGNIVIALEGGPYEKSVKFIADNFDSSVPLEIDGVFLHNNKIIVTNIGDLKDTLEKQKKGVERVLHYRQNIRRMARVALGEDDPETNRVIDYMYKGTYRTLWEAVGSKQKVVFEKLYKELGISESVEKRKVQNFFINSRKVLGELFPFANLDRGVWERTFFGSLVWRRYQTIHPSTKQAEEIPRELEEQGKTEAGDEERKAEPKSPPLNRYMHANEVDKILYGNAGEEDGKTRR